jgi:hypothetical protein
MRAVLGQAATGIVAPPSKAHAAALPCRCARQNATCRHDRAASYTIAIKVMRFYGEGNVRL